MNHKTTSKKPNAIENLRKIIKEEVKAAIREEMVPILLEVIKGSTKPVVESKAPSNFKQNLQSQTTAKPSSSPVNNLLEETRQQMLAASGLPDADEYRTLLSTTTPSMSTFNETVDPELATATSLVDTMIASAGKSVKEELVEITQVPDFSTVMKKMNL